MAVRSYFTLLERIDGKWCIAFGAYDKRDVEAERLDYIEGGTKHRDLKIIATFDVQACVTAEVAWLNSGLAA